jgi:acyl transferase domain-containing protein
VSERLTKSSDGGMMAVGISAAQIQPILDQIGTGRSPYSLTVACINSPENVTISGDKTQLRELAASLSSRNIFHRQLHVDVAYHSPYMEPAAAAYASLVHPLTSGTDFSEKKSTIMISSVNGDIVDVATLRQADYWVQNMLKPVRFADAVVRLCHPPVSARHKRIDGSHRKFVVVHLLLEIGPHAAMQSSIRDILKANPEASGISYFSAMKRNTSAMKSVLATIGHLTCYGFNLNLDLANRLEDSLESRKLKGHPRVLPSLPEYPFDHSRTYWPTGRMSKEYRFRRNKKLDLLGKPAVDWNPFEARWHNFIKLSEQPWIADHKVGLAYSLCINFNTLLHL